MKNTKKTIIAAAALAIVTLPSFTGCVSVKREEPSTSSTTTTTSVRPSVVSPSTTTVERTTTY